MYFLCETSTWHLDSCPLGDIWCGAILWVFEFNVRALKQSVREFYGRASLFVAPYWRAPKGRNSCLRLRPRSVFGSFGVVLMSCKVNFHVVWPVFQNSVCLLSVYFCWSGFLQIRRFAAYSFAVLWSFNVNFPFLAFWGSREKSRVTRKRKETWVRGVEKELRALLFMLLSRSHLINK